MYKETLWERIREWMRWTTPFYEIREAYWYLYARYHQFHMIDTKLKKGRWWDIDALITNGVFELIDSYVSKAGQDAFSHCDWEWSDKHAQVKQDIIKILHWKHIGKPELEKEADSLLHELYGGTEMKFIPDSTEDNPERGRLKMVHEDVPYRDFKMKKMYNIEAKIDQIDTDMLKRAVEIRNYLWT